MYRMPASQQHLMVVLEHLDAYAITLLGVTTDGTDMTLTFDQPLPVELAEHLELTEVG